MNSDGESGVTLVKVL